MGILEWVRSLFLFCCFKKNIHFIEFERHFKCIQGLHTEFEDCNGPADWTEDMEKEKVCK